MKNEELETVCPASQGEWRQWLQKNHGKKQAVWFIGHKKSSDKPIISWSEAVDEALCFGWIDSTRRPIDSEKFIQYFCRRKPGSPWSKINKEKIRRLTEAGLMSKAGLAVIEAAKQNGSWTMMDQVEEGVVPKDLEKEFKTRKGSKKFFLSLSRSVRKQILGWIVMAKRDETRVKRIKETVTVAERNLVPKQFR